MGTENMYTQWNIIGPLKRGEDSAIFDNRMNLEDVRLSEISQSQKDKSYMIPCIRSI